MDLLSTLCSIVRKKCNTEQLLWLSDVFDRLINSQDPVDDLAIVSAQMRRKLGQESLASPLIVLTEVGTQDISGWDMASLGRVTVILHTLRHHPDQNGQLIEAIYRQGDELERIAVTRGLAIFNLAEALMPLALESGRTNSLALFQALALNNPFPAAYYSEHQFNQLVLKCLFVGLSIEQVQGLAERANEQLSRMSEDYVQERLDANRSVPADIWLAVSPHASERGLVLLETFLDHDDWEQRCYAAEAIGRYQKSHKELLARRLQLEKNAQVRTILERVLNT